MTVFRNLDEFLALPRVSGLIASPDGARVAATVAELNDDGTEYQMTVWELDPRACRPGRPLISGVSAEVPPSFTCGGDVIFLAADPVAEDVESPPVCGCCLRPGVRR